MILLDNRIGSKDLAKYLPGECVRLTRLLSGDAAFTGEGPEGLVSVGIERKRLRDLINSMRDNRLAGHQVPMMQSTYDICYLLVEGRLSAIPQKQLAVLPWQDTTGVYSFLNAAMVIANFKVFNTATPKETATVIYGLYKWWRRAWSSHRSFAGGYSPPPPTVLITPATLLRRIAKELPGIGWGKAKAVETHFQTVPAMLEAGVQEWSKVPGIGKKLATLAWSSLHE